MPYRVIWKDKERDPSTIRATRIRQKVNLPMIEFYDDDNIQVAMIPVSEILCIRKIETD